MIKCEKIEQLIPADLCACLILWTPWVTEWKFICELPRVLGIVSGTDMGANSGIG